MSDSPPRYDPPLGPHDHHDDPSHASPDPGATYRQPSSPRVTFHPSGKGGRPRIRRKGTSLMDEILPVPSTPLLGEELHYEPDSDRYTWPVLRRLVSVGILVVFLSTVVFLASTSSTAHARGALSKTFGLQSASGDGLDVEVPSAASAEGEVDASGKGKNKDFEKYTTLRTLPGDISKLGKRLIFIGDVHGSYDPLQRLMDKLDYDRDKGDTLIHVGDLIAKGSKNQEVLDWMRTNKILGVRGNHDQPVIQWRAWMEWAGGDSWEQYVDDLESGRESAAIMTLQKSGKMFPKGWEWKGEHWSLARNIKASNYAYLLSLPLVLHFPALHSFVVHAGLLPANPLKSSSEASQPLIATDSAASSTSAASSNSRIKEEISLLFDVPQNTDPWNLINMRSVYESGKKIGEVTKSGKKGTPWSEIWNREMDRCDGPGEWATSDTTEAQAEGEHEEDVKIEVDEGAEVDETEVIERELAGVAAGTDAAKKKLSCSPVTVIYGHAAGRGLDIKPFSKGIDTGCVYGKQLTALVLGDTSGLEGETVRVGDNEGLLVSVECGKGGV